MPMDVTMSETQFAAAGWKEGHAANPRPALASQGRGHSSDEQLAHAAGRGDMAAFDALYQRHHQPLLAFARHMLGRMHDAEDVVQHTFLAADRAFRAGKVPRAVRAWLYTVARNRCVSVLRARARRGRARRGRARVDRRARRRGRAARGAARAGRRPAPAARRPARGTAARGARRAHARRGGAGDRRAAGEGQGARLPGARGARRRLPRALAAVPVDPRGARASPPARDCGAGICAIT